MPARVEFPSHPPKPTAYQPGDGEAGHYPPDHDPDYRHVEFVASTLLAFIGLLTILRMFNASA